MYDAKVSSSFVRSVSCPLTVAICVASSAGRTHISALDGHLSALNARRTSRDWPLNRGDVIEVQGPAACGKTHFLYHIILTCLIPPRHDDLVLGGWGRTAVIIDADGTFDSSRFQELLISRLSRLLKTAGAQDIDSTARSLANRCLERLVVFKPTSSIQLALTIHHLPQYHITEPSLQDSEIGLLAIDSMSSFYWRDRYALEQLREADNASSDVSLQPNHLHHVVDALQHFRQTHLPVILLSNWGLNAVSKPGLSGEALSPYYRQHLHPFPAPFDSTQGASEALSNIQNTQQRPESADVSRDTSNIQAALSVPEHAFPIHYHLTLQASPVDPFPSSYSLADAIEQEHMRRTLVERGEIRGLLRTPGVNAAVDFRFCIRDREILVDDE